MLPVETSTVSDYDRALPAPATEAKALPCRATAQSRGIRPEDGEYPERRYLKALAVARGFTSAARCQGGVAIARHPARPERITRVRASRAAPATSGLRDAPVAPTPRRGGGAQECGQGSAPSRRGLCERSLGRAAERAGPASPGAAVSCAVRLVRAGSGTRWQQSASRGALRPRSLPWRVQSLARVLPARDKVVTKVGDGLPGACRRSLTRTKWRQSGQTGA